MDEEDEEEELNLKDLRVQQNNPEIDAWQQKVLEQILAMPLESNIKKPTTRASQPTNGEAPLAEVTVVPPASQKPGLLTLEADTSGLGVEQPLEPSSDNAAGSSSDKVHH